MNLGELLAEQIDGGRNWTLRLLADVQGADWGFQPAPGLAHPLWICGHLAVAQHLLVFERSLGGAFLSPEFARLFPIGGAIPPLDQHPYPAAAEVLDTMSNLHQRTLQALRAAPESVLAEPAFGAGGATHPHYRDKRGAVAHCHRHEAFHAGQLALIRRLLGRTFLR